MVGTTTLDTTPSAAPPTVAQIQRYLLDCQPRWCSAVPGVVVGITRLAGAVHELLTIHLAAVRAINTELIREVVVLEAELVDAHAEVERLRDRPDPHSDSPRPTREETR